MKNKLSLRVNTDKNIIAKQEPSERIFEFQVKAPFKAPDNNRLAMNLAVIIDRSGSMSGRKLEYARQAASHVANILEEQDRLSLVSFDNEVTRHTTAMQVTGQNRHKILDAISRLRPGGSTFLSGGWFTGCEAIASVEGKNSINRALLLTDGLANVGISDANELGHHASELQERGISTTTLGVGLDFDHFLLERMAEQGGGNYYFIEDPYSIPEIFKQELKEVLWVSARSVEIFVPITEDVEVKVLGGWRTDRDEKGLHIHLGDFASEQVRTVYMKIIFPAQTDKEAIQLSTCVLARGENDIVLEDSINTDLKYADAKVVERTSPNNEVMRAFAKVDNAEAANEALKLEREGLLNEASVMLKSRTQLNREYLTAEEFNKYDDLGTRMSGGLQEHDRKRSNWDANLNRKTRIR